jgi:hypothetical protein
MGAAGVWHNGVGYKISMGGIARTGYSMIDLA